jgi:hypothetical protein
MTTTALGSPIGTGIRATIEGLRRPVCTCKATSITCR